MPETALVVLVNKKDRFVIPSGGTVLEAGDRMMVLADQKSIDEVNSIFATSELEGSDLVQTAASSTKNLDEEDNGKQP